MSRRRNRAALARPDTEGALRQQQALLQDILDHIPCGVFWKDRNGVFLGCNQKLAEDCGFASPADIVGKVDHDVAVRPEEADFYVRCDRTVIDTGRPLLDFEETQRRPDGSEAVLLTSKVPLHNGDGEIIGVLGIYTDITERRRGEEAIRAREEHYRLLFEANPQPMWVYDPQTLAFLAVNEAAIRHYGYSREEFLRMTLLDIRPPEEIPALLAHLAELPAGYDGPVQVMKHRRKDGTLFDAVVPGNDLMLAGKRARLCLVNDVTERERAYEEVRRSREWFQAIFQASRDGILVEDDGQLSYANEAAARLHGYGDPSEMMGKPLSAFQMPEDSVRMREYGRRRVRGESAPTVYPFRARHRDGSPIDLEASVSVCRVGSKDYIITVLRDLSERKNLEEQLRQAQKMEAVGRLAGGIAHDFNNLLTVITGYADLLLDSPRTDEVSRRLIAEVKRAGERAASLTQQLLAFSRKQVLQPQVLELNVVVAEAQRMLRRLITEDIELFTDLDPQAGLVKADPGQVDQVLVNLAVNARDAMPRGGRLSIATRSTELDVEYARRNPEVLPGPYVMLVVSDTGCGMSEDVRARIFEPFFTTKEQGKGTGLGLATVYGIVKQSGGHIDVESALGRGTTFRIFLPRVEAEAASADNARSIKAPRGTETVLLVEDEEGVRSLAREVLRASGYNVLEAPDGEAGLAVCRQHPGPVHLLLTDVIMPRMNGSELAEHLQTLRPQTRVLYLSGYTDDALGDKGVLDPDVAFLQKPFTTAALAQKVREVLDRPAGAM